jgi:hypothetical protein
VLKLPIYHGAHSSQAVLHIYSKLPNIVCSQNWRNYFLDDRHFDYITKSLTCLIFSPKMPGPPAETTTMLPPCRRGGNSDAAVGVPWVELESLARRATAAAAGVLGQVSVSSRTSSELGCWKAACQCSGKRLSRSVSLCLLLH